MALHFIEQDRRGPHENRRRIKSWLMKVIQNENKLGGVINFVFCSDEYIAEVNKEFLKRDYFTDVISFTYDVPGKVSGDILISMDRIEENALILKQSKDLELKRIMVHGLLHLMGYEDSNSEERKRMTEKEDFYLKSYNE